MAPAVFQILIALADQPLHGYGIMLDVAERSAGKVKMSPGTLYGSIKQMLEGGLRLWIALLADVLRTAPKEQLNVLMQDIRHAFRLFSRTPIVTATALITVALGVGGSTAVFSVVYAVMMRPLPYPAPDRIVELFEDNPQANRPLFRVSTLNYLSWAERATSIEALAAFGSAGFTLTDHGEPERLSGGAITASMFSVLGLPPLAGRGFRAEVERPGAQRVALIAEALWRRRFGGDPAIVGQTI